ncbi:MAG TPA: hypothetical protein VFF98_00075 [Novosphingobium sp.]|nr:hypothetical protein [Novosphingobium sp.]
MTTAPSRSAFSSSLPVVAAVAGWRCRCAGACSGLQAARCLQESALALFSGQCGKASAHALMPPLAVLVARQKSREGQMECAALARALAAHDHAAVLDACRRMIELESQQAA